MITLENIEKLSEYCKPYQEYMIDEEVTNWDTENDRLLPLSSSIPEEYEILLAYYHKVRII